ncbi:MAG TPA: alpha/beta hydrolase [Candidatus Eisenbacteria bacterium]|jgi:predicted esterase
MSERFIHRFEPALEGAGDGTLLLLHGTGGNENDLLPLGRAIAPNAALLSPRGQVLEHGMARFFRRLAEGVFDHDDLVARSHALAEFVLESAARYRFDPAGVVALGFSNGANIAAAVMLLRPEILAGAVLLRAMVPFVPEKLPDLSGRRVLVAAGKTDPVVAPRASEELAELLRGAGAEVTLHWSQGGHVLERSDLAAAAAWWQAKVPK